MRNKLLYTSLYALITGGALSLSVSNSVVAEFASGSTESGSDTDWESLTLDPLTGGMQLPNSKYESVTKAYDDTQGAGADGLSQSQKQAIGSAVRTQEEAKRAQQARAAAEEEIKKVKDNLEEQNKLLSQYKSESEKKMNLVLEQEKKLNEQKERYKAACMENNTHTFRASLDCDNMEKPGWTSTDEVESAYNGYISALQEYENRVNAFHDIMKKREAIEEAFQENGAATTEFREAEATLIESEKKKDELLAAAEEQMGSITETDKSAVLAEFGGMTTDNWDAQMQTDYTRNLLQQKLDTMELRYGTPHMDLSTDEGQAKAKELIDFMNKKDSTGNKN